ncbi:3-methylornithine--L-lysine ligase PylC [Desulfitobacterium sp. PCE1]|uniref:3-methylornithine--L-lysine ligase PylC n=1 Tax=Desulfitobacterium sp. PCE1 TaxID=146907 RepID=UPI000370311E|nr:3-methylornithine--L-lysine ligase PylC [Desulfitobacterium sp. PCE1]
MQVAVIGGKLQGVEATYLAKKAGWRVTLFDRRENAQASTLADSFHCLDILASQEDFRALLKNDIDLILPAIEDLDVLIFLTKVAENLQIPLAFDMNAYRISSSKLKSNQLFQELHIPMPLPWPQCSFPLLIKPSGASGSVEVQTVTHREEMEGILAKDPEKEWIVEEFLEGPSYSIEVIGFAGEYRVFPITELEMDAQYDCKRVLSPAELKYKFIDEFEELALKIASQIGLNGIMDVETILHLGKLKALEIDARLPSQTPTAIYHSSGINMVECLGYSFTQESLYVPIPKRPSPQDSFCIYEHLKVNADRIEVSGEHIIAEAGPLRLLTDFFGADEALTDYTPEKKEWVVTLITRGPTQYEVWAKRYEIIRRIQEQLHIPRFLDPYPFSLSMPTTTKTSAS